jgi:hypothetical protein
MFIKSSIYEGLLKEIEGLKTQLIIVESHGKSLELDYNSATKKNAELLDEISTLKVNQTVVKNVQSVKENSFETKIKAVKSHLLTKGNITSWEAIECYNATRLSAIIFNLKKYGMDITTTPETNGKSRFVRYHLNKTIK